MACEQTLSPPANVATAVSSAAPGTEVCLNAGNYGSQTFDTIQKSDFVTVKPVQGATVTFGFTTVDSCQFIRFEGINFNGMDLLNNVETHHIELVNCTWVPDGNGISINGLNDSPPATPQEIILDGCTLFNVSIALFDGRLNVRGCNGVKIRNCLIGGSTNPGEKADGIMIIGQSINTEIGPGNEFREFHQETAELGEHIDAIQFTGSGNVGNRIFENYFHDSDVFIGAFDAATGITVENNVFDATARASRTEFQGMQNLVYRHNTWRGTIAAPIIDTPKVGDQANQNNVIENNIFSSNIVVNDCSGCTVDNNMFPSGGTGTNIIIGTPTFVGGSNPTSYDGFVLASGSDGEAAASDGGDIGINVSTTGTVTATGTITGSSTVTGFSSSFSTEGTMSKNNTLENELLALFFNGTTMNGFAENDTTTPVTDLQVALHTADPGEGGTQATSEVTDTGYARVNVARSGAGWVVTGNSVSPAADITFPQITTVSAVITHWSVGDGSRMYSGTLSPTISTGSNVTPVIDTASTITED